MAKVLIVGSTDECVELAKRWNEPAVIVADRSELATFEFGAKTHVGDWSDPKTLEDVGASEMDAIFVSTGSDDSNLKCIAALKSVTFSKIIVMVYDPANVKKFKDAGVEHVVCPMELAIDAVDDMVQPETHEITQVLITEQSLSIGLAIGEILLPSDCKITSVERSEKTVLPMRELTIKKGDVLTVISSTTEPETIRKLIHGGQDLFPPFNRLFVIPMRPKEVLKAVREATGIASGANAEMILLMDEAEMRNAEGMLSSLGDKLERIAKSANVRFSTLLSQSVYKTLGNMLVGGSDLDAKDRTMVLPDCVLVSEEQLGLMDVLLGKSKTIELLEEHRVPFVVARRFNRYKKVLAFVDKGAHAEQAACYAVRMCFAHKPKLYIFLADRDDKAVADAARYVKRFCATYGLECEVAAARENASNEFADLAGSDEFDLVAFVWDTKALDGEIKKQIVLDAPCSTLVVH